MANDRERLKKVLRKHEELRAAPGRVIWEDEATGAQVLRVPGFPRLVWWVEIGSHTVEEHKACIDRFHVWAEQQKARRVVHVGRYDSLDRFGIGGDDDE